MNRVLRPACLSDVPKTYFRQDQYCHDGIAIWSVHHQFKPLLNLYDAEWRKRGFLRSP